MPCYSCSQEEQLNGVGHGSPSLAGTLEREEGQSGKTLEPGLALPRLSSEFSSPVAPRQSPHFCPLTVTLFCLLGSTVLEIEGEALHRLAGH